jgi:hypothetical protein
MPSLYQYDLRVDSPEGHNVSVTFVPSQGIHQAMTPISDDSEMLELYPGGPAYRSATFHFLLTEPGIYVVQSGDMGVDQVVQSRTDWVVWTEGSEVQWVKSLAEAQQLMNAAQSSDGGEPVTREDLLQLSANVVQLTSVLKGVAERIDGLQAQAA